MDIQLYKGLDQQVARNCKKLDVLQQMPSFQQLNLNVSLLYRMKDEEFTWQLYCTSCSSLAHMMEALA